MPTYPYPAGQKHPCRGFTLIEIAIVLLIVGIITSFAALSFAPLGHQQIKQEAQRMAQLMEYASQEAILTASELRMTLDIQGYRFDRLEEEQWVSIETGTLQARQLPESLSWRLHDGNQTPVFSNKKKDKVEDPPGFHLFFLSSGETSPFTLTLHQTGQDIHYTLSGNNVGTIQLKTGNE